MVSRPFFAAFVISSAVHTAAFLALPGNGGLVSRGGFPPGNRERYLLVELEAARPAPPLQTIPRGSERRPAVNPPTAPKVSAPRTAVSAPPAAGLSHRPVASETLLRDPLQSGVFSHYFRSVKARIQTVAARHKSFLVMERGKVDLYFVLDREGLLVGVDAKPDLRAAGNPLLVSRATQIIREAEPFSAFPAEIRARSISFSITLVFDG